MLRFKVAFVCLAIALLFGFLKPLSLSAAESQAGASYAPLSPLELVVAADAISSDTVRLKVNLTPSSTISTQTIELKLPNGVTSIGESHAEANAASGETATHTFTVRAEGSKKIRPLIVSARGILADAPVGNAVAVYLESDGTGLHILSQDEFSATHTSTKSQLKTKPVGSAPTNEPVSPESNAVNVKVKGKYVYPDHAATPTKIESNSVHRPVRFAQLQIQKKAGSSWQTLKTIRTKNDGTYSASVNGVTIGTTKLRTVFCLKGPSDDKITVTNSSNSVYCYASQTRTAAATTDFGTRTPNDTDSGAGPVNIFDTLIDGYSYVTAIQNTGQPLQIKWELNYNPSCGSCYYQNNVIDLNGSATLGAEWDDSVILHEFGHWVMHRYAASPPNAGGPHGSCNEAASTPNLEYSEGWATFFQSAARLSSSNPAHSVYGNRYIHIGGGIGSTLIQFAANLETKTGANYFDQTTNRGGYCEWGVAAALLDVFDSTNDGGDTLTQSFSNIMTAARTQNNGHYPYNLNQWWYGWTNTLGTRGGGSLGSEAAMESNLADHRVDIGVRFVLSWVPDPEDLDSHLWLPTSNSYHVYYSSKGGPVGFPYADLDNDDTSGGETETLWMRSPYPGTYYYSVFDYTDRYDDDLGMSGTGATVVIYDGNSPAYPTATKTAPGSGSGDWWNLATIDGTTGALAYPNVVQTDSPGPYAPSEAMPAK